ncbi:RNA polymerase sigma-54 factor 2 [Agaricicola taiwanensis]|uniref:RNA polymerase sigma-54 factor n=1 Tax=Agaricicola taiwanensis TaxID=591372 RepID=A0A8J2VMG9_9RHOB|nr:RNA polymerase factor sigma-54 [Agaricicola taiwanensis]GGE32545.1 RNA polymerase sigma-54 factor 2 [Agaricicola taiwanensis]
MALTPKLELRHSQTLVMTPQLMQAIRLLQLSNMDLAAYVAEELEKNPLLEASDDQPRADPPAEGGETNGVSVETPSRADMEERLGTDLDNVFPDDPAAASATAPAKGEIGPDAASWGPGGRGEDSADLEAFVSADTTLPDHLERQLGVAVTDQRRLIIGSLLIGMIDDSGYLTDPLEPIAEQLGASMEEVEEVLRVIQTFDPAGVGARSLSECLAIQLRERNRYDPAMQTMVENIELLARRDLGRLRMLCGVDPDDLADMIAEIRALTPKPGLAFGAAPVQIVVPDVYVQMAPDGGWRVELNSSTLPRVLVNQDYHAVVSGRMRSTEEKSYLAECLQSANWLTRSLEQRARTILKVASEIVRQQDTFLVKGIAHLRPLNLKTVADAISMHESTVSRVTSNKYLATPRGIFEFKYFFSAAIGSSDGGESHSAEAVRHRIRQLIDEESAQRVLSDDTLVQKLQDEGIDIARRTVAKYREGMGIPSSVDRRRAKRATA